ncbi:hypothetical protein [Staphylococcus epidermidis]|uniref:hypothetical protein n=1 Tax=Staphylococcus epidermidis TaxID=1282 RepID=UPI001EE77A5D|nr:hypothetical protein [Staphylococcus epidermidis]
MFKKFFIISVVLFAIDMISVVFKDLFLLGEKTTTMNGFLLFLTILFTISMIVTTLFYFISIKNHNTEEYKGIIFYCFNFSSVCMVNSWTYYNFASSKYIKINIYITILLFIAKFIEICKDISVNYHYI